MYSSAVPDLPHSPQISACPAHDIRTLTTFDQASRATLADGRRLHLLRLVQQGEGGVGEATARRRRTGAYTQGAASRGSGAHLRRHSTHASISDAIAP